MKHLFRVSIAKKIKESKSLSPLQENDIHYLSSIDCQAREYKFEIPSKMHKRFCLLSGEPCLFNVNPRGKQLLDVS